MFETRHLYQNDEAWANEKLGNSAETIGQWGGLLTAVTMMLNGIGYDETPKSVNEKLIAEGGFLKALLIPSCLPYLWPNCAYHGMERSERTAAPIARIDAALEAGKPVILQVDAKDRSGIQTHFVLIKEKQGQDYILYDPYRQEGDSPDRDILLTARYNHNGASLESEISAVLWFDFHDAALPVPPTVAAVPVPADSSLVYATADGVALRAAPVANGYPWKLLVRGTELTVLKARAGRNGAWIQAQDPKGAQGFVKAEFVTETNFLALDVLPRNVLPERKKWCLKRVVIENPRFQTWDLEGKFIPGHQPDKAFHTLPRNTVVNVFRSEEMIPGTDDPAARSAIAYQKTYFDAARKEWVTTRVTGWVSSSELDDYREDEREEFRKFVVKILNPTENSTDAQQYLYIKDNQGQFKARYNMCGELCVAFMLEQDIESVLAQWRGHENKEYRAQYEEMVGVADKPLRRREMETLFKLHGVEFERYKIDEAGNPLPSYIRLAETGPVNGQPDQRYADQRQGSAELQDKLREHFFITTLKIDTNTGDLQAANAIGEGNHWVVVESITRNGGRVQLYNPFPNKRQEYSFGEFFRATGGNPNTGWWVRKDCNPTFARQKPRAPAAHRATDRLDRLDFQPPVFQVEIENPTPEQTDAEQYMRIDGSRKTNLCGEFCVAFILTQSLEHNFQRWMESPTGQGTQSMDLSHLLTWLNAYGLLDGRSRTGEKTGKFSIDTILNYWETVQPDLYNSILGGGNNEKTGPEDLKTIFRAYGYRDREDFYDGGLLASPGRTAERLRTHFFITGVMIDANKGGRLGGNVPHWVVVDKITPIGNLVGGNGGWVELYNPFLNRWEEYSYREFDSAYNGGGLWVARAIQPTFTRQSRAAPKRKGKEPQKSSKQKVKAEKSGRAARTQGELVGRSLQRLRAGEPERTVARGLAKQLDVSLEEAKRLLGISREEKSAPVEVDELLCELLQVESVPPEIGRWIREKSNGDSLMIEQLAQALLALGILSIDTANKTCSRMDFASPDLSERIQNALRQWMDPSLPASHQTNWIASVVGEAFAVQAIEEIRDVLVRMAAEESKDTEAKQNDPS